MAYTPPRKRRASPGVIADRRDRRRALELLAGCGVEGCSEAILAAHGFSIEQMVELVRAGLATAVPGKVLAGGKTMEVTRLRITDEGRRSLAR